MQSTSRAPGARQRPFPAGMSPMLLSARKEPFTKDGWIFEPKLDGMRCIVYVRDGQARLYSKSGRELTDTFPLLSTELSQQQDCVLDGEIVAHADDGTISFERLQERWSLRKASEIAKADRANPVSFYTFDILHLGNLSLNYVALSLRKAILNEHLIVSPRVKKVEHFVDGISLFEICREQKFEGIVAKRESSLYQPGTRSHDWIKIKYSLTDIFAIVGFREDDGYLIAKDGLLVGVLEYGFTNAERKLLSEKLVPREETRDRKKRTVSFENSIEVQVEFMEWTSKKQLRLPIFRGFVQS